MNVLVIVPDLCICQIIRIIIYYVLQCVICFYGGLPDFNVCVWNGHILGFVRVVWIQVYKQGYFWDGVTLLKFLTVFERRTQPNDFLSFVERQVFVQQRQISRWSCCKVTSCKDFYLTDSLCASCKNVQKTSYSLKYTIILYYQSILANIRSYCRGAQFTFKIKHSFAQNPLSLPSARSLLKPTFRNHQKFIKITSIIVSVEPLFFKVSAVFLYPKISQMHPKNIFKPLIFKAFLEVT